MERQLFDAAGDGDVDEVRRLVGRVDRKALDHALHYASKYGHLGVAKYLVQDAQVEIDSRISTSGPTALHAACFWNDQLSMVQYLVETGGANVDARNNSGLTPLHHASFRGHIDIVLYLVEQAKANVNSKTTENGYTPLDEALSGSRNKDVIRYLLPRTCSIAKRTLLRILDHTDLVDTRGMVLKKYASGQSELANSFDRYPIHTMFLEFPLPSTKAFKESIKLFPSSYLSLLDERGRHPIHLAIGSKNNIVKSPSLVSFLFEQEQRAASSKDPATGLYPHETVASLISSNISDADDDGCCWLDVVYKMLRSNPQHLIRTKELQAFAFEKKETLLDSN